MPEKKTKFIVIAGSIMSGLGKGIVSSSIAKLLQSRGYKVVPVKFDGYLNVDCGTMNPFRHGEVFVLDDGTEVDMDFGTYERFLNQSLTGLCSITGGKLFKTVLEKERRGDYLGRDVQIVPHLTDEIKRRVAEAATDADIVLIEIGGTIGDLENGYFVEAMRQQNFEKDNMAFIQLTYVPSLSPGEQKTKPTQHATRLLQSLGIQPDIIVVREQEKLTSESRRKISTYCNVPEEAVFDDPLLQTVYQLPIVLDRQGLYDVLAKKLDLKKKDADLKTWQKKVSQIIKPKEKPLKIAIVGKYTAVKDAYVSVKEALVHSAAALNCGLEIGWIEGSDLESMDNVTPTLAEYDGIVVPGGFGTRGIEGKIRAIEYARKNNVPYLGLCLGLQLMVIEYARNVCGLKEANSKEFDKKTPHPVIDFLPEQQQIAKMGGTLRLGAYDCILKEDTIARRAYGESKVSERHRHRYEVNSEYVKTLEEKGLVISGTHPKNNIVEITEWSKGFGVASQAHVELKSRLESPAPLFVEFLKAARKK
ncbi:CTP synthase (glutamine hydrolyzing) [Candidatus Micrarchaeota archaeon]|nr:CTP synthase (glutamine hydrolyzing) [Candidatus Micrarchaeota archaeon]MBU1681366.1 CTP synthase (glutamine hydrolyzing) [Candidatus Micrarchaeota archaeon]